MEIEKLGIVAVGNGDSGVVVSSEEGEGRRVISGVGDGPGWGFGFNDRSGLERKVRAWDAIEGSSGLVVADPVGGKLLLTRA